MYSVFRLPLKETAEVDKSKIESRLKTDLLVQVKIESRSVE